MKSVTLGLVCIAFWCQIQLSIQGDAPKCSQEEFMKYAELLIDPNVKACAESSGFTFEKAKGVPDDATIKRMCSAKGCSALLDAVVKKNPTNCVLAIDTMSLNAKDFVDKAQQICKSAQGAAGNNTTAAPTTKPPPPDALLPGKVGGEIGPTPSPTPAAGAPTPAETERDNCKS